MHDVEVSVIVLSFNSRSHLDICLSSLTCQSYPHYEVIVVDNDSQDDSVEFVKSHFPMVRTIVLDRNYGYTGAYNLAVEEVRSKYVAFLNPDVEVDRRWLQNLMDAVKLSTDRVKVWGCKTLFFNDRTLIQNAGGSISPMGSGICPQALTPDSERHEPVRYVGYVQGSCMLVEREIFQALGGFDPDYFAYQEEIDFCWRVWMQGYRVLYVPSAIVYHVWATSFRFFSASLNATYYDSRNQKASAFKNFSLSSLPKAFVVTVGYDFVFCLRNIAMGKGGCAGAVVRGYFDNCRNARSLLRKRRLVQHRRTASDSELRDLGVFATLRECVREYMRLRNQQRPDPDVK